MSGLRETLLEFSYCCVAIGCVIPVVMGVVLGGGAAWELLPYSALLLAGGGTTIAVLRKKPAR